MWKCKKCGSTNIKCKIEAETSEIAENGEPIEDVLYLMDYCEYEFFCDDCDTFSDDIEEIAEWVEEEE